MQHIYQKMLDAGFSLFPNLKILLLSSQQKAAHLEIIEK